MKKKSILKKNCKECGALKALIEFTKHKGYNHGYTNMCKACDRAIRKNKRHIRKNFKYPFKGKNDPKYIKARNKLFAEAHGWWCNDGKGWGFE